MLGRMLRRFFGMAGVPLSQECREELKKLTAKVTELEEKLENVDKQLDALESRMNEWLGVKGYSP